MNRLVTPQELREIQMIRAAMIRGERRGLMRTLAMALLAVIGGCGWLLTLLVVYVGW